MYRFFLFTVLTLCYSNPLISKTKEFEGNISFVCETVFDTTYINILVKGDMIRVDEYNYNNSLLSSQLINLSEEKVIALSHDQKLYTQVILTPRSDNIVSSLSVRKTENHKEINGYTCYQWRVRDVQRNTEIAYWVAEESFEFFETLLKFLNRTEHSFKIFSDIPDNSGFFPLLTEERTLLRKDKLRIAVVAIQEKNLNPRLFEIPENYKSIRR